jgi:hypothetical protein
VAAGSAWVPRCQPLLPPLHLSLSSFLSLAHCSTAAGWGGDGSRSSNVDSPFRIRRRQRDFLFVRTFSCLVLYCSAQQRCPAAPFGPFANHAEGGKKARQWKGLAAKRARRNTLTRFGASGQ